jgi:hypothetical protein
MLGKLRPYRGTDTTARDVHTGFRRVVSRRDGAGFRADRRSGEEWGRARDAIDRGSASQS